MKLYTLFAFIPHKYVIKFVEYITFQGGASISQKSVEYQIFQGGVLEYLKFISQWKKCRH